MPLVNLLVDMTDYLPEEKSAAGQADAGYFDGSATYIAVPECDDDYLDEYCFADYPNLTEVFIPATVASIQSNTFANCPKLSKIVVAKTLSINSDIYKNRPWGAPSTCQVLFSPGATPRTS